MQPSSAIADSFFFPWRAYWYANMNPSWQEVSEEFRYSGDRQIKIGIKVSISINEVCFQLPGYAIKLHML